MAKRFRVPSVNVHTVELGWPYEADITLLPQLRRIIRIEKPEMVHVHCRRGDFLCALAARVEGVPVVMSYRTDDPPSWFDQLVKFPLFDGLIASSHPVERLLLDNGMPEARVFCARDAVDTNRYRPTRDRAWFCDEFGLDAGSPVIAIVAALIPHKGHTILFDALPAVFKRFPDAYVLVFGKGWLEGTLRRRIRQSQLEGNVHFEGWRPDMGRILPCVDVVVHPARREGMGVALLESAACGVPIVASRVGGIPEVVRNGLNGYLVEPGARDELADAIIDLLANPERRREFGQEGRSWVIEQFDTRRMVADNYRIYQLLTRPSRVGRMARTPAFCD